MKDEKDQRIDQLISDLKGAKALATKNGMRLLVEQKRNRRLRKKLFEAWSNGFCKGIMFKRGHINKAANPFIYMESEYDTTTTA